MSKTKYPYAQVLNILEELLPNGNYVLSETPKGLVVDICFSCPLLRISLSTTRYFGTHFFSTMRMGWHNAFRDAIREAIKEYDRGVAKRMKVAIDGEFSCE